MCPLGLVARSSCTGKEKKYSIRSGFFLRNLHQTHLHNVGLSISKEKVNRSDTLLWQFAKLNSLFKKPSDYC